MTIDKIRELVEHETGYDLTDRKRIREIVYARSVYFSLCRKNTLASLHKIGASVNKNHATVLHGIRLYDETLDRWEKAYRELHQDIQAILNGEEQVKNTEIEKLQKSMDEVIKEMKILENKVYKIQKKIDILKDNV